MMPYKFKEAQPLGGDCSSEDGYVQDRSLIRPQLARPQIIGTARISSPYRDYDSISSTMLNTRHLLVERNDDPFALLSDELCLKIFSWLDTKQLLVLAKTCRRFESLCWNPVLWRQLKFNDHTCDDRQLKVILKRLLEKQMCHTLPLVEKIYFSSNCKITDEGLFTVSRRCTELTHLQILFSSITDVGVAEIMVHCTNLQHLDVTGCTHFTWTLLPATGFQNISELQPLALQYLDLTDCIAIDDESVRLVAESCPNLSYLYLRRCVRITDNCLKYVSSYCGQLRELSVSDCSRVSDFGLYEVAKLGAAIRYLSVAKCTRVSDAGLKSIARRCYKLRYLNIRNCEAISDDSVIVLARSCPRLRALDLGRCDINDNSLRALAERCPNLKKLSLRGCDMITDLGLNYIAYYCRGLQHLNIQDCHITSVRAVKIYCKRCTIEHTNPGFC